MGSSLWPAVLPVRGYTGWLGRSETRVARRPLGYSPQLADDRFAPAATGTPASALATNDASGAGGTHDSFATRAIAPVQTRFHVRTRLSGCCGCSTGARARANATSR